MLVLLVAPGVDVGVGVGHVLGVLVGVYCRGNSHWSICRSIGWCICRSYCWSHWLVC